MTTSRNVVRRGSALFGALALLAGTALPALIQSTASAVQLTTRSIQISDSTPSATGVQYKVTFTTGASAAQELIIDFCGDTPLVGASCAFSAATVPTIASPTASTGTVTTVGSGSPIHTVKVTGLTIPASSSFTITFTGGFTNPTTAAGTSFYARILTFGTGNASGYAPANTTGNATTTGTYIDYGGIALTTSQQVTITARVMESLTFCVSGLDISGAAIGTNINCTQATAPALDIGQGSPTKVLDTSRVDTGTAFTQVSTNATSGVTVRMKATNTCANAGLGTTSGTCSIPGTTSGAANGSVAGAITAGTAAFGLYVSASALTTGVATSSGTVTPDANYYNATHTNEGTGDLYYGMDNRNASPDGVLSTYGDVIAASTGPLSQVNNHLVFGITPSLTTPAGIYTGNEILVATGTF